MVKVGQPYSNMVPLGQPSSYIINYDQHGLPQLTMVYFYQPYTTIANHKQP